MEAFYDALAKMFGVGVSIIIIIALYGILAFATTYIICRTAIHVAKKYFYDEGYTLTGTHTRWNKEE